MKIIKEKLLSLARGQSGLAAVLQSLVIKLLVVVINTTTGIITARSLQPDGRGELAALILWPLFLANALTLGLPSALVYNLRRAPERASALVSGALVFCAVSGVTAIVLGVAMMPYWLAQYPPETVRLAQLLMWHTPVCLFTNFGRVIFEARDNFRRSNAVLLLTMWLGLVGLVAVWWAGALTPFHAALTYTLNGVPTAIGVVVLLWREFRPRWAGTLAALGTLLHYGWRSYGIDLLNTFAMQLDQVLVVGLLSPALAGTYVVALSLARVLLLMQQAVAAVLFPKAAGRPAAEVIALTGRAARLSVTLTALVGVGVMVGGPWLLRLLYGAEFVAATNLLRLLVIEAMVSSTSLILAQAFMALGRPGVVTVLQGVGLALSVPLLLLLIPRWGLLGAGLALVVAAVVRLTLTLLSFPWWLKARAPRLAPERADWVFLRQRLAKA